MRTGGTPAERLAIAEVVLDLAAAAGASEAEVLVISEDAALTRFANSEIHQNVAEANVRVSLRFVRGKRVGVATTGRTDPEALGRLAALDARQAQVVEMRYFAGMSVEETAEALEISTRTVKREWSMAKAWLRLEISSRVAQ